MKKACKDGFDNAERQIKQGRPKELMGIMHQQPNEKQNKTRHVQRRREWLVT